MAPALRIHSRSVLALSIFLIVTAAVVFGGNGTPAAGGSDEHRAALAEPSQDAITSVRGHAPDLTESAWCALMESNHGDWDSFAAAIAVEASSWSYTEAAMFEFVGAVTTTVCAETVGAFLSSTS